MLSARAGGARAALGRTHCRATQVRSTSCDVAWSSVRNAVDYELSLRPGGRVERTASTEARLLDLHPGVEHALSVRALGEGVRGPWNTLRILTPRPGLQAAVAADEPLAPMASAPCCEHALTCCAATDTWACPDASGVHIDGIAYRFVTFECDRLERATGAVVELMGTLGGWSLRGDGTVDALQLHVRVDGGPWLDANRLHVPLAQGRHVDGWACCRATEASTPVRRTVTFGGAVLSGRVAVRVGLTHGDRRLAGARVAPR